MSAVAEVKLELHCENGDGTTVHHKSSKRWSPASGLANGQRSIVSLPGSTYTSISVPTSAKMMAILLPTSAVSLTLKGTSGDTGIPLSPSSGFAGLDCLISLGASPTPGILNGSSTATTCEVIFF